MNSYTDIFQGVRRNTAQAQMAFYDMFAASVFRSAFGVAGNSDEAEEIMQDCILKVFTATDLLHADAGVMKRRLRRMAVNRAIDTVRRRKDFFVAVEVDTLDGVDDEEDTADTYVPDINDIRDGIGRLPDLYRAVISLRLLDEMHFGDIAGQLNLNPSTVRVQYTRGIAKLKSFLQQKQNDNERYA
jgi:RNA polymerase sigma-70 factor (ECF subfamily)